MIKPWMYVSPKGWQYWDEAAEVGCARLQRGMILYFDEGIFTVERGPRSALGAGGDRLHAVVSDLEAGSALFVAVAREGPVGDQALLRCFVGHGECSFGQGLGINPQAERGKDAEAP